jgi:dual-specificity kinase
MVFPCCGPSVYDVLKANSYSPLPDIVVQTVVEDMLKAVRFMHGMRAIHTDLKPENVLFGEFIRFFGHAILLRPRVPPSHGS